MTLLKSNADVAEVSIAAACTEALAIKPAAELTPAAASAPACEAAWSQKLPPSVDAEFPPTMMMPASAPWLCTLSDVTAAADTAPPKATLLVGVPWPSPFGSGISSPGSGIR
jgi:hypothetical protein